MTDFRLTLGASYLGSGRTHFRVWAPDRARVDVALEDGEALRFLPLEKSSGGYFEGTHPASPGARYRYRLDGGDRFPDPCARFQPEGPHGPSEIVDPSFAWTDRAFPGLTLEGQVIYELHVGAFTKEGTFAALERELPQLAALGVTCLELMPLNTFNGRFNWGYDGVGLFAPCGVYGRPEALKRLIDRAHQLGLGVLLDVVYNHLGPSGNYLGQFARGYFSDRYPKEWGDPLNFDGEQSGPVRDFFVQNACYWIDEYHFDGLRLDATQSLFDASEKTIVDSIEEAVRRAAKKPVLLIAENEPQDDRLVRARERGGLGLDGVWVDDFHHSARVAYSGNSEAYCRDYRGEAQELLSCVLRNSLFQGQWYGWEKKRRGGQLSRVAPEHAVFFLQNHDQVANTLRGLRIDALAGAARARALTVFWLLLPQTPLLFMGQEFFASAPFLFFSDHEPDLQRIVERGRERFLCQFPSAKEAIEAEGFHPPAGEAAFLRSKLDLSERATHAEALRLHTELLKLRRTDPLFASQDRSRIEGAVLGRDALVLRYLGDEAQGDRLVLLNLGTELHYDPCPEPLLGLPPGSEWRPMLSSEEARFGGTGALSPTGEGKWLVPGHCALVLTSEKK